MRRVFGPAVLFAIGACTEAPLGGSLPPVPSLPELDLDGDGAPTAVEDRNQNGQVDPGETDPNRADTDGDGIPDAAEVATLACGKDHDRPVQSLDVPGAEATLFLDPAFAEHAFLTRDDGFQAGVAVRDASSGVVALLVGIDGGLGGTAPLAAAEARRRIAGALALGGVTSRALTTPEGFAADQTSFTVTARRAGAPVELLAAAGAALTGRTLEGGLTGGAAEATYTGRLLTVLRTERLALVVLALAPGAEPSDRAAVRLAELTDGTNVAQRRVATEHRCDAFEAEGASAADILFVVDDSGSMEDDQQAVAAAAAALVRELDRAGVDYRLGVARHFANDGRDSGRRGRLEGPGLTANVDEFMATVVVGAEGGWEPGLEVGLLAHDRLLPKTPVGEAARPDRLRDGAGVVVVQLSDERDQHVECAACGVCGREPNPRNEFCEGPDAAPVIDAFITEYTGREIAIVALVGDYPDGCRQSQSRSDFEPGQGYVELAEATGGAFGSLCGDMDANLAGVAKVATGVASSFRLSAVPISATLKVVIGPAGQGREIPRSAVDGFDYDAVQNAIVFYGSARPKDGDEIAIGYRTLLPPERCDDLCGTLSCVPLADVVACENRCGDAICGVADVCHPDTGTCGPPDAPAVPGGNPGPGPGSSTDACGGCGDGQVCDGRVAECVDPCEQTGCLTGFVCSASTHLCSEIDV